MDNSHDVDGFRSRTPAQMPASFTSASSYDYSPLNEAAHEIRLLTLLPGPVSADIRILLTTTPFTQDHVPDFEALSYAWGSTENTMVIFVGEAGHCMLSVTQNLAEALPYLRYLDEPRTLWIDAICVNQQDLAERSSQVKRMGEIFSKARMVLIWLGKESSDSSLALECLRKVSSKVKVEQWRLVMKDTTDEQHWADYRAELPFHAEEWAAIFKFLNRDWFKRLWIWQEAHLAKDATVLCGAETISWTSVKVFAHCLYLKPVPYQHLNGKMSDSHRDLLYSLCTTSSDTNFTGLVDDTRYCLCTDDRDRIFALTSILSESEIQVEPDYEKDTFDVYRDVMTQHIRNKKVLDILTSVVYHDTIEGLPSWVPDWSVPRITAAFQNVRASGWSMCSVRFDSDMKMVVTGAIVAIVATAEHSHVAETSFTSNGAYDLVAELRRLARSVKLRDIIDGNPQQLGRLCRTLCSNHFAIQYPATMHRAPNPGRGEDLLKKILLSPADINEETFSFSEGEVGYLITVNHYCLGRSLIITTKGNPGLAPKETKPGDLIVALLGCSSAMVLRPLRSGNHVVVGEAFYDGVMLGEAFHGPLPDSFQFSLHYDESSDSYFPSFMNVDTGKLQSEDPRLEDVPLPPGWRRRDHKLQDIASWYVNDETGEDNGLMDPRLSAESLRSRGVKLEEFDLV